MYERFIQLLEENNCKASDIAKATQITPSTFSDWKKGKSAPKVDKIQKIADYFNVSVDWLLGNTESREKTADTYEKWSKRLGILPISKIKIPMLGTIACGEPIFCEQEYEVFVEANKNLKADFCLTAKGDSMINARIHDGDIVFIRKSNMVNNGEIAAVVIEDSATLKRVFYYPEKQKLILQAENPLYEPLVYIGQELEQIHIIGKAVAFQSNVK